jgi:hypothetical protein
MASSDLRAWTPVLTNLAAGIPSLGASTAKESGESLLILLSTSGGSFLKSTAHGIQSCSVSGTVEAGAWLALSVRLTNGMQVVVGVTNQSGNGKPIGLVGRLVEEFNARPELQGADGVAAEDVTEGWFGSAYFNLRARTGGLEAAGAAVRLEGSAALAVRPGGNFMVLQSNVPDLQPRAHVLVRTGLGALRAHYVWDTRRVEDGFHELTVVAYEGSHVLTQSRIALPVVVRNLALQANLIMPATSELRSAGAPMLVQVTANTNAVLAIRLFSTGGMVGSATNQASAKFTVTGGSLGAGLHPFYAVVETREGQRYRTQTRFVRLTP